MSVAGQFKPEQKNAIHEFNFWNLIWYFGKNPDYLPFNSNKMLLLPFNIVPFGYVRYIDMKTKSHVIILYIFVILTCFHLTIFWEETLSALPSKNNYFGLELFCIFDFSKSIVVPQEPLLPWMISLILSPKLKKRMLFSSTILLKFLEKIPNLTGKNLHIHLWKLRPQLCIPKSSSKYLLDWSRLKGKTFFLWIST